MYLLFEKLLNLVHTSIVALLERSREDAIPASTKSFMPSNLSLEGLHAELSPSHPLNESEGNVKLFSVELFPEIDKSAQMLSVSSTSAVFPVPSISTALRERTKLLVKLPDDEDELDPEELDPPLDDEPPDELDEEAIQVLFVQT